MLAVALAVHLAAVVVVAFAAAAWRLAAEPVPVPLMLLQTRGRSCHSSQHQWLVVAASVLSVLELGDHRAGLRRGFRHLEDLEEDLEKP